jgi:RNA polymerase sigma-B factor
MQSPFAGAALRRHRWRSSPQWTYGDGRPSGRSYGCRTFGPGPRSTRSCAPGCGDAPTDAPSPLVRYFARRYTGRNEPFDDLVQAGALGLIKAVDRFEPHRGVAFSTFAAPTILGEIRRHFQDRTWAVHVHRSLQVLTGEVDTCLRDMTQQLGRTPSVAELADRMHLPPERIRESLQCNAAYRATSLATPVGSNGTLGDRLGAEDPGYDTVDTHDALGCAPARLPERDRRVLQLRVYGNMSQAQIAARIGVSQMHVSRLLSRTLPAPGGPGRCRLSDPRPLDRRPARTGAVHKRQSCHESPRPPAEHVHHRRAGYASALTGSEAPARRLHVCSGGSSRPERG